MAGQGHSDSEHHPHVMSIPALLATGGALMVLTVFTVTVTSFDFGYTANLVVAMAIATVKAIIVCLFFMHLLYDKKFNLIIWCFLSPLCCSSSALRCWTLTSTRVTFSS